MDTNSLAELLDLYMTLYEKQDEIIRELAAIVKKQNEQLRQIRSVQGFFTDESPGNEQEQHLINDYINNMD